MFQFQFEQFADRRGMGGIYRHMRGRPSWVWGTALLVGLLPFALFIALFAIAAMLTTIVIFMLLAAACDLLNMFGRSTPPDDGRRNVKVKYHVNP